LLEAFGIAADTKFVKGEAVSSVKQPVISPQSRQAGVRRIIYLGGLGAEGPSLSFICAAVKK
jgi:hypothetical protein